jgi:phospholipid:diacylglycerol acyltransferase
MLGTPKAVAALLSGEMKDTAQLNAFAVYGLEKFYSRKERATILRSFPGIASMLPKGISLSLGTKVASGGDYIWGNLSWVHSLSKKSSHSIQAPDDIANQSHSYGPMLNFQEISALGRSEPVVLNRTMSASMDYLITHTPHSFHSLIRYIPPRT